MSLRTGDRELGTEKLEQSGDVVQGLGPLREQEPPGREFPNLHCPHLQLWPPSCWAEPLAKAAGHLLTWPAVPKAEAPAGAPPAQLLMPAQEAETNRETKPPRGR